MLLTGAYELSIVSRTGDSSLQGDRLTVIADTSINDLGRVAFTGETGTGTALFAESRDAKGINRLTFQPSVSRQFSFPRINNDGFVVARDRVTGSPPDTAVRLWDADRPGVWVTSASSTKVNSTADYNSVTLPTLADDNVVSFVGLTFGGANTDLYSEQFGDRQSDGSPPDGQGEQVLGALSGGGFRPMGAEGGRVVVQDTPPGRDRILMFGAPAGGGLVANGPNFADLGAAPGVSGDGAAVAFYGDLTAAGATALNSVLPAGYVPLQPGPGIFLSLAPPTGVGRVIQRVAGVSGNRILDPGETFTDANRNGRFDTGETDIGPFTGFAPDSRVGVGYEFGRLVPRFTVGFLAAGTGSVMGLYTVGLDASGAAPSVGLTNQVVAVGETIDGMDAAVSSVSLWDPVNDSGQLVFSVQTVVGQQAAIRASAPDTDHDGLYDAWEDAGRIEIGGSVINLPGADKKHKNLYVEVDAMVDRAPRGDALDDALDDVVKSFGRAPNELVKNPDGRDGVTLYIERDEWDIPKAAFPELDPFGWPKGFDAIKGNHVQGVTGGFGSNQERQTPAKLLAKSLAYRYCIFADSYGSTKSSGLAEPGGNDFMVTLGRWATPGGTREQQAGTFMHELGHTLGLNHGGRDGSDWRYNYKPNYHSVMNYTWQTPQPGRTFGWELDYSQEIMPTLDEKNLNESNGINPPGTATDHRSHLLPVGPLDPLRVSETGAVDWSRDDRNKDGTFDNDIVTTGVDVNRVEADMNGDKVVDSRDESLDVLHGYEDWSHLAYSFRQSAWASDGVHAPVDPTTELSFEQAQSLWLIGSQQAPQISGRLFEDLNSDGDWDAGEMPVERGTVYIDLNLNGVFDAEEPAQFSDQEGRYGFDGLVAGAYRVGLANRLGWRQTAPKLGFYTASVASGVVAGDLDFGSFQLQPLPRVVARHIFYSRSAFDGDSTTADARDDAGIGIDKWPLLPGQQAEFANVTSYSRGINGIIIDLVTASAGSALTAANFGFKVGTSANVGTWADAPIPTAVVRRAGAGEGGSDRYTITWMDGAIKNTWLQVTVKADADTGLAKEDVFYFGNLTGEAGTGNSATRATVNARDMILTRAQLSRASAVDGRFDYNRDGRINAIDIVLSRKNSGAWLPLITAPLPLGVVSSLPLPGEAKEVVVIESPAADAGAGSRRLAYVATGSHGLAIVDASTLVSPTVVGQLDLPGDSQDLSVDPTLKIAALACGVGGLCVVDVSNPALPRLLRTIPGNFPQVEAYEGTAYVATDRNVAAYDLMTGEQLQLLNVGTTAVTGLTRVGTRLFALLADTSVHSIDVSGPEIVARYATGPTGAGGKLSAGNGVLYIAASAATAAGGFATVSLSNPDSPGLVSGPDTLAPESDPSTAIGTAGAGLAVLVGQLAGVAGGVLDVMDVRDPANTNTSVRHIALPSAALGVTVSGGVAFVAGGAGGVHVVNYHPADVAGGVPPTVQITTPLRDLDPLRTGRQVPEGVTAPLAVTLSEDAELRTVEVLLNGQVVHSASSAPFNYQPVLPVVPGTSARATATLHVRATDTGGNVGLSNVLTLELLPDTTKPTVTAISPAEASAQRQGLAHVTAWFSEPLAPATVIGDNFRLLGPQGQPMETSTLQLRRDGTAVHMTFMDPLPVGSYQIVLRSSFITDRAGNPLGTADVITHFTVENGVRRWVGTSDGSWDDPSNWSDGRVPGAQDDVEITAPGTYTITIPRDVTVGSLLLGGTDGTQVLETRSNFTITGPARIAANGAFSSESDEGGFRSQSVAINGDLIVQGELNLRMSRLVGAGQLTIEPTGTLALAGSLGQPNGTSAVPAGAIVSTPTTNRGMLVAYDQGNWTDSAFTNEAGGVVRLVSVGVITVTPPGGGSFELPLIGTLGFASGMTNRGTILLEDATGGGVSLRGSLVNEVGGVVEASDEGTGQGLEIRGTLINRGTLRVRKSLLLMLDNGYDVTGQTFDCTSGTIEVAPFQFLRNGGPANSSAKILFGTGTVLRGPGTISFERVILASDFTLAAGGNLQASRIDGPGQFVNRGTYVIANGVDFRAPMLNEGLVEVFGGCYFTGAVTNAAGARFRVVNGPGGAGAAVAFYGSAVNRGKIELDVQSTSGGVDLKFRLLVNEPGGLIDVLDGPGANRTLSGALDNRGVLRVRKSLWYTVNWGQPYGDFTSTSGTVDVAAGQTLYVNDSWGATVFGTGTVLLGSGTISAGRLVLESDFTLPAGFTLQPRQVNGPATLTNRGTLEASGLMFGGMNAPLVNQGLVIVSGALGVDTGGFTFAVGRFDAPVTNEAGGVIRLTASTFRAHGLFKAGLINRGTIQMDNLGPEPGSGSSGDQVGLEVTTLVNEPGGVIDVLDGAGDDRGFSGALDNRGTLRVRKTFKYFGNLTNSGVVEIRSGATLSVSGSFTAGTSSVVSVELGGAAANQFAKLSVAGAATLAGSLAVRLVGGYRPASGQAFQVVTFASAAGLLSLLDADPADGITYQLSQNPTELTVTAVPVT